MFQSQMPEFRHGTSVFDLHRCDTGRLLKDSFSWESRHWF
ncbi:hypothetical protein Z950_2716 [Sulfitobacter mediterraneus KCTC 32188]|nr:hypothetical protein Z950_2716 [Sulfitobacter mediterraneus KCTC 32188]